MPRPSSSANTSTANTRDPAAIAFGTLRGGDDLRAFADLGAALDGLDASQVGRILEQLEREQNDGLADRLAWLFKWWMKRDPKAAAAWIRPRLDQAAQDGAMPSDSAFQYSVRSRLFTAWIKTDAQGALEYARNHAQTGLAIWVMQTLDRKALGKDEAQWLTLLREFPESTAQRDALKWTLSAWAEKDGAAALVAAQSLPVGPARDQALGAVLGKWSERDATAAFQQYQSLGLKVPSLLSQILANAMKKDRSTALGFLGKLDPADFARASPKVIDAWAKTDPSSALTWALEHGVSLGGYDELEIKMLPSGLGRSGRTSMSRVNPLESALFANAETTLNWIQSLPAGAERERFITLVANSGGISIKRAIALISELPPEALPDAAFRLGTRFSEDPAAGRAWAESLPDGPARAAAWQGLGMVAREPLDLPPGPDRDAMLYGRAFGYGTHHGVASTLDLTLQIGDPVFRRDAMDQAMEQYTDLKGLDDWAMNARAWLEKADVPDEWKQRWR